MSRYLASSIEWTPTRSQSVSRLLPFRTVPPSKRQCIRTKAIKENDSITPLDSGRRLAKLRADERLRPSPLFADDFAAKLAADSPVTQEDPMTQYFDLHSIKFIDDNVLKVVNMANVGRNQEYNQVVLVGDGMCTRAFRLPWPSGTVIYLVAPGEVHERAEAILAADQVRVPRGCLLRRVDCDVQRGVSFLTNLEMAGYRGDRLSVWALQGIRSLGLKRTALEAIFNDMSNAAALESILIGELPGYSQQDADNLLASYGLMGVTLALSDVAMAASDDKAVVEVEALNSIEQININVNADFDGLCSLMFRAQQRRLSLQEIGEYEAHVAAAEEVDEDFFGNFS